MDPATDEPTPPGMPRLDRRTILVCVAIAATAAAGVFVLLLNVLADDTSTDASPSSASSPSSPSSSSSSDTDPGTDPSGTLVPAKEAPDVEFTRFDGSTATLSDFRGQKLVVNFFASTCIPCKKEMPALQRVHERLGDDVTFVGIAVQDDPEAAQDLIDQTGVSYDLGQDPTGSLFQGFGGVVLPVTAFVAEDGTVMELHAGKLTEAEITQLISDNLLAGG
jgi:thiol-disulfide isomerase/thioredoxin